MKPKLSFYQENNIYIINDECEETLVMVCIKAGCGQEPPGKNGIAHLVEHICLAYRHYIPTSSNSFLKFNEIRFRSSGFTNYGQTVLMFSFPSHMDNIHKFHQILKLVLSTAIITKETFNISKTEILAECKQKGPQWYWQQDLISFITHSQINELPVGKFDEIVQLQMKDAVSFIQNNYTPDKLALIYFTGLQVPEIISDLYRSIPSMETVFPIPLNPDVGGGYAEHHKFNLSVCRLEHPFDQKILEIYYQQPYRLVDLKTKLTRMLFEIIVQTSIEEYAILSPYDHKCSGVSVSDKHVSAYFYYAVFTLTFISADDTISSFAEDIVERLKQLTITEERLRVLKESISPYLSEPNQASRIQLFQNVSSHIFYGEPIHITCKHYKQLKETLDQIEISDIVIYKNWILNAPCKIVTST
ncbi:insulinase family protein [Paenibacillus sp. FSL H8-0261]|uniref:insulinase family protein n=1 Tax=Paenibacillus sp. FSL H8-0261 TaxID=2921381 RepID=UPI0032488EB8